MPYVDKVDVDRATLKESKIVILEILGAAGAEAQCESICHDWFCIASEPGSGLHSPT